METKKVKKLRIKESVKFNVVASACYLTSGSGATCVMNPYS